MQHVEELIQDPGGRGLGFRLGVFVGALEDGLGELQVPVAERAPGEVIEGVRRLVELVGLHGPHHPTGGFHHVADDPAVDRLPARRGIEAGPGPAPVHLAEAGRVPQLGGEVAVALDPAFRQPDVAALHGQRGEGEPEGVGAVGVDEDKGVDDVALGLGHLLARHVAHQGVDVDGTKRHPAQKMEAHHDHPRHPEEDDVEPGDQHVRRVVAPELRGFPGPAEGRERPQGGREPGIQHVLVAPELHRAAVVLFGGGMGVGLGELDEDLAVGAIPRRDLVPPPDLARDAPGLDVAHPLEVGLLPRLGHEPDVALLHRLDGRLGQGPGVDEPLVHQPRFYDHARAVAVGQGHQVLLDPFDKAEGFHLGDHLFPRLIAPQAPIALGRVVVEPRVAVEHVDHLQAVAAAHLEVVEVVARGYLHRAGALFRVGVVVGDDRYRPVDDGEHAGLPDKALVAAVVGVHGHRGIAEHGLRAGGGDGEVLAFPAFDRVLEVPHLARDLALLHLQVRNRRAQPGVPVDQPLVLVDQPLPEKVDEHLAHRRRQPLVQGEALPGPVGRGAQTAQLAGDRVPRFGLPLPHPLDEFLAAEAVPGQVLLFQPALHHHLGGDAGVVAPGLPQHVQTAQAVIADENVLQGERQRMPHVQAAGHVGRRHHDAIGRGGGRAVGREGAGTLPQGVDFFLDLGGPIGLVQHR